MVFKLEGLVTVGTLLQLTQSSRFVVITFSFQRHQNSKSHIVVSILNINSVAPYRYLKIRKK
jgi:hypothetical protein